MVLFPRIYLNRLNQFGAWLHSRNVKADLTEADELFVADSEHAYAFKKLTLGDLADKLAGDGLASSGGSISPAPDAWLHSRNVKADLTEADELFVADSEHAYALKKLTLGDLADKLAGDGLASSGGSISPAPDSWLHSRNVKADLTEADELFVADSEHAYALKKLTLGDLADKLAGDGLASSGGSISPAPDSAGSMFYFATEFDFSGSDNKVATKISDHGGATALLAKGKLVAALVAVTQATTGTTSNVISIAKDNTPTAKLCGDCTITIADDTNKVGCNFMLMPVAGANAIVDPASEDIYAVADVSSGRNAGKVYIVLVFVKTA